MGVKGTCNILNVISAGKVEKGEHIITSQDMPHISRKLSDKDITAAFVDCSWVVQQFSRVSNNTVNIVMTILHVQKGLGYHVVPIVDSYQQNDTKRKRN